MIHSGTLVCRTFGLSACHLSIAMNPGLTLAFSFRLHSIRACLRSLVSKVGTYNPWRTSNFNLVRQNRARGCGNQLNVHRLGNLAITLQQSEANKKTKINLPRLDQHPSG